MPRTKPHRPTPATPTTADAAPALAPARAPRGLWLTRTAFVLAAAVVVARATMLETLRNPLDVIPGTEPIPRGPGAAAGVVLDLLACLPALLVLARRAVDPAFALRFAWSLVPMALLALWTVASVAWAGDKFAAAVSGFHWLAASVLLWSAAQLVRHWLRLRLVAAVCFGLLLAQVGEGFYKKYVEYPELKAQWEKSREEILRQRAWEPGSFHAMQFEKRVLAGEIMGFTSSPNSYAAVLVLLTAVSAGVLVQRLADRDAPPWAAVVGVGVAAALAMVALVESRTAYATTALGAATLGGVWLLRRWLARRPRLAYGLGLAAVLLALAAVVGHGLYHGNLFEGRFGDSLNFRWRYWAGSARLFALHPLAGVGWENFGPHYLSVRLPVASEEIKDPHNFLVRFATELGAVGLALVVAWMVALWWDLTTRPADAGGSGDIVDALPPADPPLPVIGPGAPGLPYNTSFALGTVLAIAGAGVLLNVLAAVDWGQSAAFVALELMRRVGYLCLLVVGAASAALRSMERQELDDRPAPWVLYGTLTGLGLFLAHNLLDFSLFEPGPMTLFAFVCGAALGIRLPDAGPVMAKRTIVAGTVAAGIAWLAAAGALAAPLVVAEQAAFEGDDALRRGSAERAADAYARALDAVPYNADYAARAGRALLYHPNPRTQAERSHALLARAAATDPSRADYWLSLAGVERLRAAPEARKAREWHERAVRLDPNNVDMRLDYADLLHQFGDRPAAAEQYREALRYNDLLSPDEPKRLPPERLAEVRKRLAEVEAPATAPATPPATAPPPAGIGGQ